MSTSVSTQEYPAFLAALKERIQLARTTAARAVNRDLILLYWDIGRGILEKQKLAGWGASVVERLAVDLRSEFPDMRGFSANNLWLMRQFYSEYSTTAFLEQLVQEMKRQRGLAQQAPVAEKPPGKTEVARPHPDMILEQPVQESPAGNAGEKNPVVPANVLRELVVCVPWGHHVEVLKKVKSTGARLYYLRAISQLGWSRNVLVNQIKAGAYERATQEKKTHNFALALPEHFAEQADEMLKSRYHLEFLGISRAVKERELEDRLIARLQEFILELGYGFCFVGRQYRLTLGLKEYFVDLLFYHRFLKALVAFDLKISAFTPEHAGKMDFYLNLLNEKERAPDDRPSIGIILCAEKDDIEVEFALKTKTNPIGVAEYELQAKLPADLKGRLPTAKQLADVAREIVSK